MSVWSKFKESVFEQSFATKVLRGFDLALGLEHASREAVSST